MIEKEIEILTIDPVEVFGVKEEKLKLLKSFYPKLKIVARGTKLKVLGEEAIIADFEKKFAEMVNHYDKYNALTEVDIANYVNGTGNGRGKDDVIVFGNKGMKIKARSANQTKLVEAVTKNDMTFAIGPAGTGKTYTAVALAVKALKENTVRKIIMTRPAVEAGERLGFLPGDMKEKLDPYMQPLYDALFDMIPPAKLRSLIENRTIEIAPLAFMRGRTLDNAFVIFDEAQNATYSQLKMFLTRMGRSAKFVITGDLTQIDLPKTHLSGLSRMMERIHDVEGIAVVRLGQEDVNRHRLVKAIINAIGKDKEEKDRTS
ncbi:MAG: PhoH family protein [Flavobacteriales bacterium]|nr:PhoH family protein [Flavobacteriales bacterium]